MKVSCRIIFFEMLNVYKNSNIRVGQLERSLSLYVTSKKTNYYCHSAEIFYASQLHFYALLQSSFADVSGCLSVCRRVSTCELMKLELGNRGRRECTLQDDIIYQDALWLMNFEWSYRHLKALKNSYTSQIDFLCIFIPVWSQAMKPLWTICENSRINSSMMALFYTSYILFVTWETFG